MCNLHGWRMCNYYSLLLLLLSLSRQNVNWNKVLKKKPKKKVQKSLVAVHMKKEM